ncbi:MAG: MBL fold metallo-hydrolase [Acutalibacteraceae bacterium]|nr:MBL fold metallo-hydrolase [Acutalibacteraceae bacterium]
MRIQFIGAVHEVTGSCTLLEVNEKIYLVDCGMEQGIDVFQNIPLPVPASSIEAVFLTHAHIDHSGMLPKLYKDGFKGSIYATDVTCDLCNIMLRDSAYIQESEAKWQSKKEQRAGREAVEPTYNMQDAIGAISCFRRCNYGELVSAGEGVQLRFTDVGHLLGSACIEIWLSEGETEKKIVFSGDVGNINQPIIRDPQFVDETDYLVIESTYGNRLHKENKGNVVNELAGYIQQALDKGGNVIIPSFAVGRTQELLYTIREIKQKGLVTGHEHFPVYVDSPLASESTAIFMQCNPICFDEETTALIQQGINPIWFDDIYMTATSDESKLINLDNKPKVIISASGMCEAGRIRHHLKHNLWKENNIILFVGYQAEGSLGRKLMEGAKTVKLFGEEIAVNAQICSLHGSSGHADCDGLINWISAFKEKPELIFVNHGDDSASEDFKNLLIQKGYNAEAPYSGTEYDLATGKMTVYTEGVLIDRVQLFKGSKRANMLYNDLVSEAEKLLALAKARKGRANKDNAKLTSQIRELLEKWKD